MRIARPLILLWASSLAGCVGMAGPQAASPFRTPRAVLPEAAAAAAAKAEGGETSDRTAPVAMSLFIADPPARSDASPPQLRLASQTQASSEEAELLPALAVSSSAASGTESEPVVPHDDKLRLLQRQAARRIALMDTYCVRMRRREMVQGKARPEDTIECKFRQSPFSVHMKWSAGEGKGREVIYVQSRHDNLIHTLTAAGDVPLIPAGHRFRISPDSALVRNRSRHPIADAGVAKLVDRFGKLVDEQGAAGKERSLRYVGLLKRPEFEQRVECVFQVIPPGSEPGFSEGGQRLWFFDADLGLPVLIVALDDRKREIEYYCFDRFQYPAHLTDNDFHPDRVWR